MVIFIVDLPIYSMVIFHSYVSLPEGNYCVYVYIWYYGIRVTIYYIYPPVN